MKKNLEKTKAAMTTPRRPAALRFSPTAWAKLLFVRDVGETEIGGFGISAADDLLFVEDVQLVSQVCTWVHVAFDDEAVADLFDRQVDAGRRPEMFGRIWVHTHPGNSPEPSGVDEATFARVFGGADWALMFIVARGGQTYARLRYNCGPGADLQLPVEVDYSRPFTGSGTADWHEEYLANVWVPDPKVPKSAKLLIPGSREEEFWEAGWRDVWGEYADFERYQPEGEHGFIDEY